MQVWTDRITMTINFLSCVEHMLFKFLVTHVYYLYLRMSFLYVYGLKYLKYALFWKYTVKIDRNKHSPLTINIERNIFVKDEDGFRIKPATTVDSITLFLDSDCEIELDSPTKDLFSGQLTLDLEEV